MALVHVPAWSGPPQRLTNATIAACGIIGVLIVGAATSFGALVGVAAVFAVGIGIAVLRYPVLGGYSVALLVPITSGLRRGFPIPSLRISEIVVVAMAVLVLVPATGKGLTRWGAVDWAGLAYVIGSVALPMSHVVIRGEPILVSDVTTLLLPLQFFLIYRTVRTALTNEQQRAIAVKLLLMGSLFVSVLAVVQQLNIGPARDVIKSLTAADALDSYGYSVYARATGPFQHWHPLAGYLVVILLLGAALLLEPAQKIISRRWLIIVVLGAGAALMASVTFISIIGVVVGALILGARYKKLGQSFRWLVGAGILAMIGFGSYVVSRISSQYDNGVGGRRTSWVPQTVQYRFDVWQQQYLPALSGRWLAGYGPDLPPGATWTHTESVYITLALRGGIPLLALFALSMITVMFVAKRIAVDPERRPMANALYAIVGVSWFMQFLFPYFTGSGMPQPFWVLAGISLAGWQSAGPVSTVDVRESNRLEQEQTLTLH